MLPTAREVSEELPSVDEEKELEAAEAAEEQGRLPEPGSSTTRSGRETKQPDRFTIGPEYYTRFAALMAEGLSILADPFYYEEAMAGPHAKEWQKAMEEEMATLLRNGTWVLVEPPPGRKIIGSKWVYKTKLDKNGNIQGKAGGSRFFRGS